MATGLDRSPVVIRRLHNYCKCWREKNETGYRARGYSLLVSDVNILVRKKRCLQTVGSVVAYTSVYLFFFAKKTETPEYKNRDWKITLWGKSNTQDKSHQKKNTKSQSELNEAHIRLLGKQTTASLSHGIETCRTGNCSCIMSDNYPE